MLTSSWARWRWFWEGGYGWGNSGMFIYEMIKEHKTLEIWMNFLVLFSSLIRKIEEKGINIVGLCPYRIEQSSWEE